MTISQHPVFYATVMLLAGLGIPVMAALNGGLGTKLQSPMLAATILFGIGLVASLGLLIAIEGLSISLPKTPTSVISYLGGLFIVFYIFSITWIAPKFGVGNAVFFVLLGQIISVAIIDHFGLMGALHHPISLRRAAGLILMSIGVFLAVRRF
ncbi:MAG: DMT family transporter [Porticoccaceae bacterium]|jgi:transporter family-2 protein|nr:DMT family transporter [Porticoccaceae bacterium]